MLSAQQAAWGAVDPLRAKFTKEEKATWTKEDKKMYKCAYDLHGLEKATYTMRKKFAKREAEAAGIVEPVKQKAPPKPKAEIVLINDANPIADRKAGRLLVAGTMDWDTCTSNKSGVINSLWGFHSISSKISVKFVASGTSSCHTIAISADGRAFSWGRNKHGQLGLGDTITRPYPTEISSITEAVSAGACGQRHTMLITEAGSLFGCGSNTEHQLGLEGAGARVETIVLNKVPQKIATSPQKLAKWGAAVTRVACGSEFSAAVDCEGKLALWGKPEYGQLGNGTNGEYLAKGNKIDYNFVEGPELRALVADSGCSQVSDVACGNNHTIALMADGSVFSWGFGGYGRLGHRDGADQLSPKQIEDLGPASYTKRQGTGAKQLFAGSTCSYAIAASGTAYFWGTTKPSAEATMFPKPVSDLSGWSVTSLACGNSSTLVAADSNVISWGPSPTFGELGYGDPEKFPKSSSKGKLVMCYLKS